MVIDFDVWLLSISGVELGERQGGLCVRDASSAAFLLSLF